MCRAVSLDISTSRSLTSLERALPLSGVLEQTEQHLVMTGDRVGAGRSVRAREAPAQRPVHRLFQLAPGAGQLEQALAAVALVRFARDQSAGDQVVEQARQRLLGEAHPA